MEATLIKNFNIDKTNWVPVKFGDVVAEPRDTVKNIVSEGIEHVVGLEHIETENIHLRNSAGIEESTTFTKKFSKGDVLFGRRRAYLKKAAQASFSGICSGDITVLRAKKGLLPELLPFIVNNDKFFDHAIKHSAGGLSPRVKFKDLANYEFLLPPKDQQAQFAELLWAMDDVIEKDLELLEKLEVSERLYLSDLFLNGQILKKVKLEELYKKKFKSINPVDLGEEIVKHFSLPSYIENKAPELVKASSIKSNKIQIDENVVLFSKLNPNRPKIWEINKVEDIKYLGSTEWLPVKSNDRFSGSYIVAYLSSQLFLDKVMRFVQGTSNSHKRIDPSRFYELEIPILREIDKIKIEERYSIFRKTKQNFESKITSSKDLQKSLINQIF